MGVFWSISFLRCLGKDRLIRKIIEKRSYMVEKVGKLFVYCTIFWEIYNLYLRIEGVEKVGLKRSWLIWFYCVLFRFM